MITQINEGGALVLLPQAKKEKSVITVFDSNLHSSLYCSIIQQISHMHEKGSMPTFDIEPFTEYLFVLFTAIPSQMHFTRDSPHLV